jgi:hypothetical protein
MICSILFIHIDLPYCNKKHKQKIWLSIIAYIAKQENQMIGFLDWFGYTVWYVDPPRGLPTGRIHTHYEWYDHDNVIVVQRVCRSR